MKPVTCTKHLCEFHQSSRCPCICKVCTNAIQQAVDDNNVLAEMLAADFSGICSTNEHEWPDELDEGRCVKCGLVYAEWTE